MAAYQRQLTMRDIVEMQCLLHRNSAGRMKNPGVRKYLMTSKERTTQ